MLLLGFSISWGGDKSLPWLQFGHTSLGRDALSRAHWAAGVLAQCSMEQKSNPELLSIFMCDFSFKTSYVL